MAKGGRRPGAGSPRGPKRKTIARAEAAAIAVERARAKGHPLAIEVLEEFMVLFRGTAARHQPIPKGTVIVDPAREPDPELFEKYARLTVETAAELAPYQSAKHAAIRLQTIPAPGPTAMPGDNARLIEGHVTQINDPVTLTRVYKGLMARPKV